MLRGYDEEKRKPHHKKPADAVIERRANDSEDLARAVKLLSGQYHVSNKADEMIVTILGSCVAACICDPVAGVGGMNHFLLPEGGDDKAGESARYGAFAMEQLINGILAAGGMKHRLEVKVFGGANVINNSALIGSRNVSFVRQFLKAENLRIVSEDLGDTYPRRVRYFPATGKAMLMKLRRKEDMNVVIEEKQFVEKISRKPVEGDIELF